MQSNRMLVLLGLSGLLGCATSGLPPGKEYTVPLTPGAETPPCDAAGPTASGSATIVVAADDKSITATVSYGGLNGGSSHPLRSRRLARPGGASLLRDADLPVR